MESNHIVKKCAPVSFRIALQSLVLLHQVINTPWRVRQPNRKRKVYKKERSEMALDVVCFVTFLYFLIYAVIAQGGYYNEVECKLLSTQNDISSQFRLKASEKGVRMVYLNLKIGNESYHPLELQDEFLADRWVWANNITEPMLSLFDDFEILSLGLLNYQVRSMDVHLKDQPSGCLANLNSITQNMVVGRMLLENVTTESSADRLSRKREVVCVAMIEDEEIVYRCCGKTSRNNQPNGPSEIQCDQTVENNWDWMDIFNGILIVVSVYMTYYLPAFPLALPDYIFSLQDECDKEDSAKAEKMDSEKAESDIRMRNVLEQMDGGRDSHDKEETGASEIPVDDSSPVTCSARLRACIQKLPDSRLSFNIKLAVMLHCILPCVLYVQMGLWLTLKKKYINESLKKRVLLPGQSAFPLNIYPVGFLCLYVLSASAGLAFVLFLKPKDFLFRHDMCLLCKSGTSLTSALPTVDFPRKSPDSIGNEILCHLRRVQQLPAFVWSAFTQLHMRLLEKLLGFCTCSLSMVNHHESRLRRALCVLYVLFSTLLAILVGLFGAICLNLLLLIYVVFLLIMLSPYVTLGLLFLDALKSRNCCTVNRNGGRLVMAIIVFIILLLVVIPLLGILLNSSFVVYMLGFIMIGLYLNTDIVTPYVAFFLVVTTNIYLCYVNLQDRYRKFKELLLKYRQKNLNISNGDQDTIPTSLFWFVSDMVLPVATETCRMFRNMALIIIFLSLFLSAVLFFKATYSISAVMSAVSVFVSGVIPRLFFKGITKGKVFVGWEKIKMKTEIEIAVEEFERERNGGNSAGGGMRSSEMRCCDQV